MVLVWFCMVFVWSFYVFLFDGLFGPPFKRGSSFYVFLMVLGFEQGKNPQA